jgi:hypothetical protein
MPKAKTSFVWQYFVDITKKPAPANGEKMRKCKLCPYIYKSKATTTTAMVQHLRAAHNIIPETSSSDTEETETGISR